MEGFLLYSPTVDIMCLVHTISGTERKGYGSGIFEAACCEKPYLSGVNCCSSCSHCLCKKKVKCSRFYIIPALTISSQCIVIYTHQNHPPIHFNKQAALA